MGSLGDRADRRPSSSYLSRCPSGAAKIERRLCICRFAGRVGPVCMPLSYQIWRALPQLGISGYTAEWQSHRKHKRIRYLNTGWVGGWNWWFYDDLKRYGVSHETCQACYQEANVAWHSWNLSTVPWKILGWVGTSKDTRASKAVWIRIDSWFQSYVFSYL